MKLLEIFNKVMKMEPIVFLFCLRLNICMRVLIALVCVLNLNCQLSNVNSYLNFLLECVQRFRRATQWRKNMFFSGAWLKMIWLHLYRII